MPGNQPQPPSMGSFSADTFPEDLDKVGYSMFFPFYEYQREGADSPPQMMPAGAGGTIALPIPDTINDQQVVIWDQVSFTDMLLDAGGSVGSAAAAGLAAMLKPTDIMTAASRGAMGYAGMQAARDLGGLALQYYSATRGLALNPFMVMVFQRPDFKEYVFQWTLSPRTQAESEKLNKIIKKFKKYMLPKREGIGGVGTNLILKYPNVVKPQFVPDQYLFKFKFCAILDVAVDYTPAGPSFFNSQAPTAVKFQVHLKEIDLRMQDDEEQS